jgi:hypothetical protein
VAGTNALRAAGVDIFIRDATDPQNDVVALDFKSLAGFFSEDGSASTNSLDEINADLFHLVEEQSYYHPTGDHAAFMAMMKSRNLRPHEELIRDSQIYSFITRDGAEGLLQIARLNDNPREIRIHYKLVRKKQPNHAR